LSYAFISKIQSQSFKACLAALCLVMTLMVSLPESPATAATPSTTAVAAGGRTNCAIRTGGVAYCWGANTYGQIGDGTTTTRSTPTLVSGNYTWASISTVYNTNDSMAETCGVTTAGAAYCWGSNTYGQIGDGTTTPHSVPTLISGGYTWASIAVGERHVCGVTTSNVGYCWGDNTDGQIGDNTVTQRTAPTLVNGGYTWSKIATGWYFSCGWTTSGSGYCWGSNTYGQIGDNTVAQRNIPTAINGSYTWASISTGSIDTCGVTTSHVGYCWGDNTNGQIGDNAATQRNVPTLINGGFSWASISEGAQNSCGVTTSGTGYCWGDNVNGEVGDGTTTQRKVPTALVSSFTWSYISAGPSISDDDTNCGITTGSLTLCWGYNNYSQIGDSTSTSRSVPTGVLWANVNTTASVAAGAETNCAVRNGGIAYCWGNNAYGQVGDGTTTARMSPTIVLGGYVWASISTQVSPTNSTATTCGVTTSGAGYCWGKNGKGQVGDGTTTQRLVPTLVSGGYTWASITVGIWDTCGVTTTGAGYCWGFNTAGEVGDTTTSQRTSPTLITGSHTWSSLSEGNSTTSVSTPALLTGSWSSINTGMWDSCGFLTTGAGYCWGYNHYGEVGNNSTTEVHVPTSINGGYNWAQMSEGNQTTCGTTTTGAGYCWGYNGVGQIGDNTVTSHSVPTAVNGGYTFASIQAGLEDSTNGTSCGVTTGSSIYCWGYNNIEQVGDQTTTNRSVPTAVVWTYTSPVTQISAGGQTNCALKNGNAFCWGDNTYGEIGDGTTTSRTSPTLVGGGYTWESISTFNDSYPGDNVATTCGITTSGTAYCWGANKEGEVGDGTTTQRNSPTLVSGGYTWASISVGWRDVCGVTTSGIGYCWGYNLWGEVGDNTQTQRNSPTLVSGGYTWASISSGDQDACGITISGTGYCWGVNSYGQVGDNTTTNRFVPTALYSGGPWASINVGTLTACGVTTTGAGYCWGRNTNGEIGDNTTTAHSVPTSVNGGYTWASISNGRFDSCGVTTAGAGYCWGMNGNGEIGNGNTTTVHVPTAVLGGLTLGSISAGAVGAGDNTNCGVTRGGAPYCWGSNSKSQVGDGTTTNQNVPTAVVWPNSAPNAPTSLAQYKSNGVTSIGTGTWMNQTTAVFSASVSDADAGDIDALCIEIVPASGSFTSNSATCGSPVVSGNTVSISLTNLPDAAYKWQAETVDTNGLFSSWTSFNSGSMGFGVDTTAPTTGTVFDGSSAGSESIFSTTSLSSLSCNWAGFADAGSGIASYDYSIGTSPGLTDVAGWTNVSAATTLVTANSLSLRTSQTYFCNVRANDNLSYQSSVVSSSGQLVAPLLTFTISSNSVVFSALKAANSYTDTKTLTLTTSTNGYGGYLVHTYETGALSDGTHTIADYSSSSSSPSAWSGTGFGFTVSGGASVAGFASGTKYAHFGSSASPDTPVSHSGPITATSISNEQETMTLKVASTSAQPAGVYKNVVVMSCTGIF
jgi:alpha-tubulin suppressor-like RCC1 family protein